MNWTPIERGVPRDAMVVLVTYKDMYGHFDVTTAFHRKGVWMATDRTELLRVVAWALLPRPYTGE